MTAGPMNEFGHYVYTHHKKTNGAIFYVGMGRQKRAWSPYSRSEWWKRVATKHGWTTQILSDGLSEEEATSLEIMTISRLRGEGLILCNMTDGGEGRAGSISSRRKTVYCSNGMTFASTIAAARWLRSQGMRAAHAKSVSAACTGKKVIVYGHCWSYADTPKIIPLNGRVARARSSGKINSISVYCSDGRKFDSASDAALAVAGSANMSGKVLAACRGERLTAFGYTWSFQEDTCPDYEDPMDRSNRSKSRPIICSNGMVFPSRKSAVAWGQSIGLKLSASRLTFCTKSPNHKNGGFYWHNQPELPT